MLYNYFWDPGGAGVEKLSGRLPAILLKFSDFGRVKFFFDVFRGIFVIRKMITSKVSFYWFFFFCLTESWTVNSFSFCMTAIITSWQIWSVNFYSFIRCICWWNHVWFGHDIAITHENKEQQYTLGTVDITESISWAITYQKEKRKKKGEKKGKKKRGKEKRGKKEKKRGEVFQNFDSENPAWFIAASRRDAAICAKSFTIELQTPCANTVTFPDSDFNLF